MSLPVAVAGNGDPEEDYPFDTEEWMDVVQPCNCENCRWVRFYDKEMSDGH